MLRPCQRIGALGALLATIACVVAAPAGAQQIPGATYAGTLANGGAISFSVAGDGSRLTAYRIASAGAGCTFLAQGLAGQWEETPIAGGEFSYVLNGAFSFSGTFAAPQSAAGTTRLTNPASPGSPECDSGPLAWTATTASLPGPVPQTAPPDTGGPPKVVLVGDPDPAKPTGSKRTYKTTVSLRRRSAVKLSGRLTSLGKGCRSARLVTLKRGRVTIARAASKGDGSFTFKLRHTLRTSRVRASVAKRTGSVAICAAAQSKTAQAGPLRSQTGSSPGTGS